VAAQPEPTTAHAAAEVQFVLFPVVIHVHVHAELAEVTPIIYRQTHS